MKRGICPRIDANLREGEIGSWFSLALPIKTTAGFSLWEEWGIESAELGEGRNEEGDFARELTRICAKRELRLFVVSALPIQHPALFCIGEGIGDGE
jgi:hypothetical protein